MQLMTDSTDGPEALRLAASFLQDLANITDNRTPGQIDADTYGVGRRDPVAAGGATDGPSFESAHGARLEPANDSEGALPLPAHLFGRHLPAPLLPPPNAAVAAAVLHDAAQGEREYDGQGMPWDARIHQEGKGPGQRGVKKDGTWKNRKGLDAAVLTAVTAELLPLRRGGSPVSLHAGPSVGVASPPAGSPPRAPAPPAAHVGVAATGAPIPAPPAAAVHLPPPPAAGVPLPPPPAAAPAGAPAVRPFIALMRVVTTATAAQRITSQRVNEIVTATTGLQLPALSQPANEAHCVNVQAAVEAELMATGK